MNKKVIIIGTGISGCTIARLLAEKDYSVEIYEKNNFIGGNCHDYYDESGILIHKYGPHIFHTSNEQVWNFVNRFSKFNGYINKVLVEIDNKKVQMPINFNSIKKLCDRNDFKIFKKECKSKFKEQLVSIFDLLNNLEFESSKKIINHIYKNVYENYTMKMWGISINEIDKDILKRVKINLNNIWNYFPNDKYQGLPINGYTKMLENMIEHKNISINLNKDISKEIKFTKNSLSFQNESNVKIIFTGMIDKLFNYKYGKLEYRSLNIIFESHNKKYYQEIGVINYPSDPKITRITEYKYLTKQKNVKNKTTISKEIPGQYSEDHKEFGTPFYPINNDKNINIFNKYVEESKKYNNFYLLGRLANYKYYDMDDAIEAAFDLANEF